MSYLVKMVKSADPDHLSSEEKTNWFNFLLDNEDFLSLLPGPTIYVNYATQSSAQALIDATNADSNLTSTFSELSITSFGEEGFTEDGFMSRDKVAVIANSTTY